MADLAAFAGRALLAAVFLFGGYGKLMAPDATMAEFAHLGLPLPSAAYAVALVIEIGVAALFLVGVKVRWMALVLAGWCIATALVAHYHPGDRGQTVQFMKNVAMAGGFLQVFAFGGGRFALMRR